MTPSDFRAARKALGMTQPQFAAALGYGTPDKPRHQTISQIENGDKNTSRTVDILVGLLLERKVTNAVAEMVVPVGAFYKRTP